VSDSAPDRPGVEMPTAPFSVTLDSLTDDLLTDAGFRDPARARSLLRTLSGQGVTDDMVEQLLPGLMEALRACPDPDRALTSFHRWIESVTSRFTHVQLLIRHPAALRILLTVCGTSQLFADCLVRNPEYVEILANPGVRGGARSAGALYREASAFVDHIQRVELRLEALRRFKHREFLRIGVHDILGLAGMPATALEFSNLADACVQKCLEIAAVQLAERGASPAPPIAVIALGKLGGRELNYSSDIDLLFVSGDAASGGASMEQGHKLAELVVQNLSRTMQNGHLFRVDMRLRPEGRFGALVRTLDSYRAYYESWAEPWELQALLKARFVAGDPALGDAFSEMTAPFVYRRSVPPEFVEAIRANKRRMEKKAEVEGQARINVKVGVGGIRDIEFAVQLLQLQHGRSNPALRTSNTLDAIARLCQAGLLSPEQAHDLAEDYQFLRNVEHRLQLLYDLQTQSLPTDPEERRLLARRLGYPDADAFDADYARRTARVRAHASAVLYGEPGEGSSTGTSWRDLLDAIESTGARVRVASMLAERGFRDPNRAVQTLHAAVVGTAYGDPQPENREALLAFAGQLLEACARTGDPDAAFAGIELVADAAPNRSELYRSLSGAPDLLDRLCRLAAGAPESVRSLARHLEWMDLLVSEEIIDPEVKPVARFSAELQDRLALARTDTSFWDALAAYVQRERLRISARDLWGEIGPLQAARELSHLAQSVIQALLDRGRTAVLLPSDSREVAENLSRTAVIGLGKLGGCELGYGSDWDVLLVYEAPAASAHQPTRAFEAVNALAEWMLAALQQLRTRGAPVEMDFRLRPEGRFGQLARTPAEYRDYYLRQAHTWERQVLVKARPVAGCEETGRAYMRVAHECLYRQEPDEEMLNEIRAMKRRMETERLKPGQEHSDIKLGHGGMSDIEFTAQLWQLRVGARHPAVRCQPTVEALHALGAARAIPVPDAARLAEAYRFLTAVRNRMALLGVATDTLPDDPSRLRALAVSVGEGDTRQERAEERILRRLRHQMQDTRGVVERLFYSS